jgi:hypothetical protein
MTPPNRPPIDLADGARTRPAGMCKGAGHLVVYGNPAFREVFGAQCVGLPAREGLLGLPAEGFAVLDGVFRAGRPAARWIRMKGVEWRLTAAPRRDPGTDDIYGVAFHLRRRDDLPVVVTPPEIAQDR